MTRKKTKTQHFEQALQELTTIVEQMEKGNLSLEDSLATFERGVKLARECQQSLQEASQKVQILTEKNELEALTNLSYEEDNEDMDE